MPVVLIKIRLISWLGYWKAMLTGLGMKAGLMILSMVAKKIGWIVFSSTMEGEVYGYLLEEKYLDELYN
jgi:hypothetical protein